jgi:hypothetical protein
MSAKTRVFLFGHSFPARLLRQSREQRKDVSAFMSLNDNFSIFVEGHPGLTFARVFDSLPYYFAKMRSKPIDILLVDLGTNDLCHPDNLPDVVVDQALRFLDELKSNNIAPKRTIFLSVIKRSVISRSGQVSCSTFNHRVKDYNRLLNEKLRGLETVEMYSQRRVNNPKYLIDGCHPTSEGLIKYSRGIREAIYGCKL